MKTANEIEREIHRRFSEQVYPGMSITDYHSALTHVIVRYVSEALAGAEEKIDA
jgi:hypothetical protein